MAWVELTEDDVRGRIIDPEVDALDEDAQNLPRIIAQVVAKVRGACLNNPRLTAIGPDGTIPDFILLDAVSLIRVELLGGPPVAEGYTNPRRDAWNKAIDAIKALSSAEPAAFGGIPESQSADPSCGGCPLLRF